MPVCEGCGGSYDNVFKFCPNCGRATPESSVIKKSSFDESALACPKCRKDDNVAKISAILQRDIHQTQGQVPVTSVHTDDYGKISSDTNWHNVSSTQMSNLAQALLPPQQPVTNGCGLIVSIIGTVFVAMFTLCWGFGAVATVVSSVLPNNTSTAVAQNGALGPIGSIFCYGVTAIILCAVAYYYMSKDLKYKKDYPTHRKLWEEAMHRHSQLYYCFRDDCIFIPGENTFTSPSNLMNYINWRPYSSKPPFRIFQF